MCFQKYHIIILTTCMVFGSFGRMLDEFGISKRDNKASKTLFPRIEYSNEWQPVGKGDPLKDPTYDYLPPVLDRVRYWANGSSQKNQNDVLVLGAPIKKLIEPIEKSNYGPIKRTFFSPYQSHYSSFHQQQQTFHSDQSMSQPKKVTEFNNQKYGWKTKNNNVYADLQKENSKINFVEVSIPHAASTTLTKHPSMPFLPTIPPTDVSHGPLISTTKPMFTNGQLMSTKLESSRKETTKPLLQSILQSESALPFNKKPSSVYKIEYTSSLYKPEEINDMATKPSDQPISMTTTLKTSIEPFTMRTSIETPLELEQRYVSPSTWGIQSLIIEGHSKVKTYGLKTEDELGNLPKIRPVQAKENPIVERLIYSEENPEYHENPLNFKSKGLDEISENKKKTESTMESLLNLFGNSFDNFLSIQNNKKAP